MVRILFHLFNWSSWADMDRRFLDSGEVIVSLFFLSCFCVALSKMSSSFKHRGKVVFRISCCLEMSEFRCVAVLSLVLWASEVCSLDVRTLIS